MNATNSFISSGLIIVLIGCLIEIIGIISIKNKELFSNSLLGGFLEANIKNNFISKYRQIEGFSLILLGTVLQLIPNVFNLKFTLKINLLVLLFITIIIVLFLIDHMIVELAVKVHEKELQRRENLNKSK